MCFCAPGCYASFTMKKLLPVFFILTIFSSSSKNLLAQVKPSKNDTAKHSLNEITVSSRYYRKYKLDKTSNTLKLKTPVLQLPQNIQEIDKSVINDQQAISINESITRNVSGAFRNNTADLYSPYIFMRGAAISTLRNGVDVSMIYIGPTPEDAELIDRVEFIKGPAGFINAIGDPAGSFNIVTKQPGGLNPNQISFIAGSFNLYRLSADLSGNLDKNQKWQYRLNALGQKAKSFQKYSFNDKFLVDPVLKYNISDHSSVTAEYIYQKQQYQQYLLTVFSPYGFASLPRDFSITDPNKKPETATENNAFLTYHYDFNTKWQLTTKATFAQDNPEGNYFFVSAYNKATPNLIQRRVTYEKFYSNVYAAQAFINGGFKTGGITHQVLGGLDYNRKNFLAYSGFNDKNANPALYPLNPDHPVYGISFDSNVKSGKLADIATNKSAIEYGAAYAQDELQLLNNKLRITLAARLTAAKSSVAIPTISSVANTVLTPRFGLSYSVLTDFTAYALFDQTYTPQSGISIGGGVFAPLKGKNLEAGLKKDWFGGKWNSAFSVYAITRDNVIVSDPATNLQSQIGQTKTSGLEFDLKGEIVKGLNAVINYAYTDSYIANDANKNLIGLPTPYRVKHIQNTWLNYHLPALKGVSLSGGYQLQAGRIGRYPQDGSLPIANIFRVDGGVGWSNAHYAVNGLINNIFNRFNYGTAWTRPVGMYAYVPYPPREFRLNLSYNF